MVGDVLVAVVVVVVVIVVIVAVVVAAVAVAAPAPKAPQSPSARLADDGRRRTRAHSARRLLPPWRFGDPSRTAGRVVSETHLIWEQVAHLARAAPPRVQLGGGGGFGGRRGLGALGADDRDARR